MRVIDESRTVQPVSRDLKQLCRVAAAFYEAVDTPVSLACYLRVKYHEWDQIADSSVEPRNYLTAHAFRADYQAVSFLAKVEILPTSFDRRSRAEAKWRAAESSCQATNKRLEPLLYGNVGELGLSQQTLQTVLLAQRKLAKLLGPGPTPDDWGTLRESMAYGPGATTSVSGDVTYGRKYTNRLLDGTPDQIHNLLFLMPPGMRACIDGFRPVDASECIFVPKNAKIERVIAKEPDCGILLQKGIAAVLRGKSRSWIDFRHQAMYNQWLASVAYDRGLATIDLSSASDMVSIATVLFMLPPAWVEFLRLGRTPSTTIGGESVVLEKWSSMGNAYTFELESLIFHALSLAATEMVGDRRRLVSTWGDDMIVPQEAAPVLVGALEFLGFSVNSEKSFTSGEFFESCGTDYFKGRAVRPFFVRQTDFSKPETWYVIGNGVSKVAHAFTGGLSRDARFLPTWVICFTGPPRADRLRIPLELGDTGFWCDLDEIDRLPPPRWGWSGFTVKVFHRPSKKTSRFQLGGLRATLAGQTSDNTPGKSPFQEARRGLFGRPQHKSVHSLTWTGLGPWL